MIFNQLQADSVDHNFKWLTYNNWEIYKKCNSIYWKLEYSINQSKIYMRFIQSTGRPKSIDILTYIYKISMRFAAKIMMPKLDHGKKSLTYYRHTNIKKSIQRLQVYILTSHFICCPFGFKVLYRLAEFKWWFLLAQVTRGRWIGFFKIYTLSDAFSVKTMMIAWYDSQI